MRRLFTTFTLLLIAVVAFSQTGTLSGRIVDQVNGAPIPRANVIAGLVQTGTDANGEYSISGLPLGKVTVTVTGSGIETISNEIEIKAGNNDWSPKPHLSGINEGESRGVADVALTQLDLDDEGRGQSVSGLLSSSGDAFSSAASYVFSAAYFKARGYDSENSAVYMNGVKVNDAETGWPAWSEWGGLNDVTRNKETTLGMNPSEFAFGLPGGATNIITRASQQRKQTKLTYSFGNKSYTHRAMITHSTGLMQNGWAFSVSASKRYGEEGLIDGSFYDSYSYFAAAEKKFNERHSLAFSVMGVPTKRAQRGAISQEMLDLTGDIYYNPNWGYQNGEKRSSRIKHFHEPIFTLNHYWDITPKTRITTSLYCQFGFNGTKALNWYNAADPRPDYYRNLPSYYYLNDKTEIGDQLTELWKNDPSVRQIDWNAMYQANYTQNAAGKTAAYIMEDRRIDQKNLGLNILLNSQINDYLKINGGIEVKKYAGHHYKLIDDLLGANYWLDVDQFAERDFNSDSVANQSDVNNPDRKVYEGDTYGYNYKLHQDEANLWANAEFSFAKIDFYVGAQVNYNNMWREGLYKNGRFPENSFGDSEKKDYVSPGAKAGATYKINGRNYIVANLLAMERAPMLRDAFLSQRISNQYAPGLDQEKIFGGELSYILRTPIFKARLTAYHTEFKDQVELRSFYHEDYNTFVNMVMTGINKTHQGVEAGLEFAVTPSLTASAAASFGDFRYTNRPTATTTAENGSVSDITETVYIKNFYVPGAQTNGTVGLAYRLPSYWFFNLNANYFADSYLDFDPTRRTLRAIDGLYEAGDIEKINEITAQEKLSDVVTLDASIGKSLKFGKYYLNLNFSVSNILDNEDLITGGYEQLRFDFDTQDKNRFPSKYYYGLGRTYYLNIGFRF